MKKFLRTKRGYIRLFIAVMNILSVFTFITALALLDTQRWWVLALLLASGLWLFAYAWANGYLGVIEYEE